MPLTPSQTRALLDRLGHRPRRRLGQNFLVDGNIVRKSLALASVVPGDRIVEIGPGLGTLTGALLDAGADVWAIETDTALHAHLHATLVPLHPGRLHLTLGDAVANPLASLPAEEAATQFKVVANLPYAISTPWMDALLEGFHPERMVLMLQEESAARFTASPGSKSFGPISIVLQSAFECGESHPVSSRCFFPVPDVDSRLLELRRRAEPVRLRPEERILIRSCFRQRRKQIAALLRDRIPEVSPALPVLLDRIGVSPAARPEQIPIAAWQQLAHLLTGER